MAHVSGLNAGNPAASPEGLALCEHVQPRRNVPRALSGDNQPDRGPNRLRPKQESDESKGSFWSFGCPEASLQVDRVFAGDVLSCGEARIMDPRYHETGCHRIHAPPRFLESGALDEPNKGDLCECIRRVARSRARDAAA